MKKFRKILLGLTSVALSLSLAGCSASKDGTARTANDGNEKDRKSVV